ncbi:MAG: ABC transporter ATP-binding protein [Candidatus Dormiibacterota bacterium]
MTNAVEIDGLTKDYGGHRGIFDLHLAVHEGEAFGFIGPNGAGKSTTLRLLMDLIRPDRGSARIMGMDTQHEGVKIRALTGYLPGEAPEYPNHSGERILDLLAHLRGGVDPVRVSELATRFDLDLHRKYRTYSHGNKQKVWLIQAFMNDPQLLFLDEPTTGLDPLMQQVFRELVAEARRRGATIFLSSHVLSEVQEICDRIGVVHDGTLRQVGTMEELRISHIRRVVAIVEKDIDRNRLVSLSGVSAVVVSDHRLQCTVSGKMEPLLEALLSASVVTLDSSEMSLEELFLAQYGQPAQS